MQRIKVYTVNGSASCRRLLHHYRNQNIEFVHTHITNNGKTISMNQINELLQCSLNGFEDLISKRSRAYKSIESRIDSMNVHELMRFISDNPTILKYPLVVKNGLTQCGLRELGLEEC